ncbi:hypothetical protein LINGRAHAP2_LOCUS17670 [Linum grandiflorum]
MTKNCSSNSDLPPSTLFEKRRRIRPEVNALNLISKLGDDLLVEILIRLPNPKSSCRCKAVCKPWKSIISDPSFNRRFIAHHRSKYQPPSLFIPSHDPQSILSFLPIPDKIRPYLRVFDCFKDLLLCGFSQPFGELERSYFVCNPFTKQWIALPLAPRTLQTVVKNGSAATLVCHPCSNYKPESAGFVYSEYQFRVVRLLQFGKMTMLEVFCSESGKWTQTLLKMNAIKMPWTNVVFLDERLFWMHYDANLGRSMLYGYNPFSNDVPLVVMNVPSVLWKRLCDGDANFSVSQGDFHIVVLDVEGVGGALRNALYVCRMHVEGPNFSWTWQRYEMVLKTAPSSSSRLWGKYELDKCSVLCLHPENPEIIFFKYMDECVLSFNPRMGKGEPELLSAVTLNFYEPGWRALQPRVSSCWPTPIPRYDDLRCMYDGSYHCWVQNITTATTTLPSAIGIPTPPPPPYVQVEMRRSLEVIKQEYSELCGTLSKLVLDMYAASTSGYDLLKAAKDVIARLEDLAREARAARYRSNLRDLLQLARNESEKHRRVFQGLQNLD